MDRETLWVLEKLLTNILLQKRVTNVGLFSEQATLLFLLTKLWSLLGKHHYFGTVAFSYTPPSPTTSYTYYVAAYNSKGEKGPSSSWTGTVSNGGGGGPLDFSPEQQLLQLESPQRKGALPPFLLLSLLFGGLVVVSSLSLMGKNLYFRRSKELSIHGRDRS